MNRMSFIVVIVAAGALAACTADTDTGTDTPDDTSALPPGSTSGGEDTTFDHMNDGISPWDLVDRLTKEGPPRYTSHVHSCSKVRYETLGNVLKSVGVNVANTTALSAGDLYRSGGNAMGQPNYENRIRENIGITTSGASREFDIFAAAAPEVIAAIPTLQRCQVNGTPAVLFNAENQCEPSGITCLLGVPATAAHLDLCNLTITSASTPEVGKQLAVAALLAAAYTCE
jgi:hypothetical protein